MALPLPTQPLLSADDRRGVVSLEGDEAPSFLQGLVSNDVMQVGQARAIYAALLTAQGRYLHDFFIAAAPGGGVWIECEADRRQDLIRRLTLYRLRAKVRIADTTEDLAVLRLFGAGAPRRLGLPDKPGAARPLGGGIVFVDPRMAELGARAILPQAEAAALAEDLHFSPAPPEAYDRLRLALGVPDGSRDLEIEKALPMESGFDVLNAIDWQKGCYVGQELTARMRYRSLVKRRLIPVAIEGPTPEPGTPVMLDGAEAGMMRTAREGYGLALLRLDKVEEAGKRSFTAGQARIVPRS